MFLYVGSTFLNIKPYFFIMNQCAFNHLRVIYDTKDTYRVSKLAYFLYDVSIS